MMKKISSEVKIGIVAIITIGAFIWMYSFLKGTDLLTSTHTYHVIYNEINGLEESNPVEINGYKVGVVQDIHFINDGSGRLAVAISVDKDFDLPSGTTAEITTATLIAGMKIILNMGESAEIYNNHDTISGYLATSFLDVLAGLEGNIADIIIRLDSSIASIDDILSAKFKDDLSSTMENASAISANFREISEKEKRALMRSIEDLNSFTSVLAGNKESLNNTLKNLAAISDTIASSDLSSSLASLKGSLAKLDTLLNSVTDGNGTAGKIVTDDSLYVNLSNSLHSLDLLLQDMKDHPKKYVHFSLFGKKEE